MNREEPVLQLVDVLRTDFRPSSDTDALNAELQQALCLPYRYHPARLAIGLSLQDPSPPTPVQDASGRPIKGETLFGHEEHDLAVWLGLLIEHSGTHGITKRMLQETVAAHWHRGMQRLWLHWTEHAGQDILNFYASLLDTAGRSGPSSS